MLCGIFWCQDMPPLSTLINNCKCENLSFSLPIWLPSLMPYSNIWGLKVEFSCYYGANVSWQRHHTWKHIRHGFMILIILFGCRAWQKALNQVNLTRTFPITSKIIINITWIIKWKIPFDWLHFHMTIFDLFKTYSIITRCLMNALMQYKLVSFSLPLFSIDEPVENVSK